MGIFSKFNKGLSKSRTKMTSAMEDMLDSFDEITDDLYSELEEILVMSDVGVYTALQIVEELKDRVSKEKIKRPEEVKNEVKEIVAELLDGGEQLELITKPAVLLVIGVNGVGKTTSIGKLAAKYTNEGKEVILGAADTFRAAAIDQLDIWAKRTGVDIVKHKEGADPAAVVFDTISAAKSRDADIVIIDTAGRLHNKKNLMDELNKIYRVVDRELPYSDREVLLVLDATTGQNAVSQAKSFQEATDNEITGIILTKLDGTARGGVVLAIKNELKIPVKFIGVGEQVDDLQPFNPRAFAEGLFEDIPEELGEEESTYHDAIAANKAYYESIQHSGKIMEAAELNRVAHLHENSGDEKSSDENKANLKEASDTPIYNAADFAGRDESESISDEELKAALSEIAEVFNATIEEEIAENAEPETITETTAVYVPEEVTDEPEIAEEIIEEAPIAEPIVEEIPVVEPVVETVPVIEPVVEAVPVVENTAEPTGNIYDIFGSSDKGESSSAFGEVPTAQPVAEQKVEEPAPVKVEPVQPEKKTEEKKRGGLRGLFNRHS